MPMNRNTSSNGAPKRSASRLDRMPAITRTAPRKMAMLTESREAMNLRKNLYIPANTCNCILIVATVERQPIFRVSGNVPDFKGLTCSCSRRIDSIRSPLVEICRRLANQLCLVRPDNLERDFADGLERDHRGPAQ